MLLEKYENLFELSVKQYIIQSSLESGITIKLKGETLIKQANLFNNLLIRSNINTD